MTQYRNNNWLKPILSKRSNTRIIIIVCLHFSHVKCLYCVQVQLTFPLIKLGNKVRKDDEKLIRAPFFTDALFIRHISAIHVITLMPFDTQFVKNDRAQCSKSLVGVFDEIMRTELLGTYLKSHKPVSCCNGISIVQWCVMILLM